MTDVSPFVPVLLWAGSILLAFSLLGVSSPVARFLCAAAVMAAHVRYMAWRWTETIPQDQSIGGETWAYVFLVFETLATASAMCALFFASRTIDRSRQADQGKQRADAPVDVFICTYNEDARILERTIVCALQIAHADLRVWVLDDGARDWVHKLALQLGAQYVRRVKGQHAKAGNINNGLKHALSTGRKPEFILVLDADFAAHEHILRRTLPLFDDERVGIVQTPQHFFNPDPIQANLVCASAWPDEQRFFFNVMMASKDAWGAAFCCGTSAIIRAEALVQCGGMATETVTEDMLTTYRMEEHGWKTIFLNERLSVGLAPEGLDEYITQRSRWCLGSLQQVWTRWSFAGPARISLISRLSGLDSFLYWTATFPFRLLALVAPVLFWWTGAVAISATPSELVAYFAPSFVSGLLFMGIISSGRILPLLTDVTQLVAAVPVARTIGVWMVRPFGHPFKVTPKGGSRDSYRVHWDLLTPFLILFVLTAAGMALSLSQWHESRGEEGFAVNVIWSLVNLLVLGLTMAACVEAPRLRTDERFPAAEICHARLPDGSRLACRMLDISPGGALLADLPASFQVGARAELLIDNMAVPFEVVRRQGDAMGVMFHTNTHTRRMLISRLFAGEYSNEVAEVRATTAIVSAVRRLFA